LVFFKDELTKEEATSKEGWEGWKKVRFKKIRLSLEKLHAFYD